MSITAPFPTQSIGGFSIPRINSKLLTTTLIAGAFATIGFDLFGQFVSPLMKSFAAPYLGAKLAPVALANQSLAAVLGVKTGAVSSLGIGHAVHTATGLLAYPLGYIFAAQPIAKRILPQTPWWVTGAAYGIVLFVFALYVMAHLVAGNPPFLGWGSITWVALWGHMIFGIIVAGIYNKFYP